MKEFYEGIILISIGTSYLLLFQYFSHGLLFLETSHMTFPFQSHCPKWGKTTPLAWRTFISKHRRYRCQTVKPVPQRISNIFLYVSISPINHHMKRFFGFDALRLNICQKAFCERIMLSRDVSPRFIKNIITWWKFYISFQWSLKWNRYLTWFS